MIGDRIKEARNYVGFNQNTLAEKLGISKRTMLNYEKNEQEPTASTIIKIAKYCNVNEMWLLTGKGSMTLSSFFESENLNLLLCEAITISREKNDEKALADMLTQYIIQNKISDRFKNVKEKPFWALAQVHDSTVLELFLKTLKNAKVEDVTEENANKKLKEIVENYERSLFKDGFNGLTAKTQSLLSQIVENFDDFDCYIILKNIPKVIEELEKQKSWLRKIVAV